MGDVKKRFPPWITSGSVLQFYCMNCLGRWQHCTTYSNRTASAFAMSWTIHISSMELSRMKKPRRHIGYVVAQVCDLRFDRIIGIWKMSLSACYSVFCFGCDVTAAKGNKSLHSFGIDTNGLVFWSVGRGKRTVKMKAMVFSPLPILSSNSTGAILESLSQKPERSVWRGQMHLVVFFVLSLYIYVAMETIIKYS